MRCTCCWNVWGKRYGRRSAIAPRRMKRPTSSASDAGSTQIDKASLYTSANRGGRRGRRGKTEGTGIGGSIRGLGFPRLATVVPTLHRFLYLRFLSVLRVLCGKRFLWTKREEPVAPLSSIVRLRMPQYLTFKSPFRLA